jgi:hypothetical protein
MSGGWRVAGGKWRVRNDSVLPPGAVAGGGTLTPPGGMNPATAIPNRLKPVRERLGNLFQQVWFSRGGLESAVWQDETTEE